MAAPSGNISIQIWVGLRGISESSPQTWSWRRAKFDKTPPSLVITNPISYFGSRPTIQLQGYCSEPIASLYFDVTNAAGCVTNQQGFVSGQVFNTNTFTFTTNWFQCFDIGLTNGVNSITLSAVDLAGNTSITNFSYILDYYYATNPPVITLAWPQNNTQISGPSFALRGRINDPTVQLSAQVVGANRDTIVVDGLVERDGLFWVEGLPLNVGTNRLTLSAKDAAGNITTTNINIIQSALHLTVNDFSGANLHALTTTVSGTLSDEGYSVWVNGVLATNNGDGSWTALNVPINRGGTAIVQARAIPKSDNGGNGTRSGLDMRNPISLFAVDVNPEIDKPSRVYLAAYYSSWSSEIDRYVVPQDRAKSEKHWEEWQDDGGGFFASQQIFIKRANGPTICNVDIVWPRDTWPTSAEGISRYVCDNQLEASTSPTAPFNVDWEQCEEKEIIPLSQTAAAKLHYCLLTKSSIRLFTGGKSRCSQALFAINATIVPRATTWDWGPGYTNGAAINPQRITIPGLGKLGNDGILWQVLSDGVTVEDTPLDQ